MNAQRRFSVVLLVGLLGTCETPNWTSPTESASSEVSIEPSTAGEPTPTPAETPGEGISFAAGNECTSTQEAAFRIAYPDGWYVNSGIAGFPDCRLFGPEEITAEDDPGIDITLSLLPPDFWTPGPITGSFEGITILVDEETQLANGTAWVREFERTDEGDLAMDVGDRWIRYELALPNGWLITGATTGDPPGPDYDALKAALLEMMTSIIPAVL